MVSCWTVGINSAVSNTVLRWLVFISDYLCFDELVEISVKLESLIYNKILIANMKYLSIVD